MMVKRDIAAKDMQNFLGPTHVDTTIRQAIQMCWMAMPKEKKTVKDVEALMRQLFERAIKDLRDDARSFGKTLE